MKRNYGLLGENIEYSFSPTLHKEIFDFLKLNNDYTLFNIDEKEIPSLIQKIKDGDIEGINITIPYKEKIFKYLEEVSPTAKKIGAINTIYKKKGKLIGENTDYLGFLETIKRMKIDIEGKRVAILGSGGSAKAVLQVIKDLKGIPFIVSRTPSNIENLFKDTQIINYEELSSLIGKLIVNCTPLGNKNHANLSPVPKEVCENWEYSIDLNYTPEISVFLSYFHKSKRSNGLYMLVAQGVQSEILWEKQSIPLDEIYDIIYKRVYRK